MASFFKKTRYPLKGGKRPVRSDSGRARVTGEPRSERVYGKPIAVGVFLAILWLALWGRALHVQVIEGPNLAKKAKRQHVAAEFVVGERGSIFDGKGRLLAKSVAFESVSARPVDIDQPDETAARLASILNVPAGKIREKFKKNDGFVWIARRVDDSQAQAIRNAKLPGIKLTVEYGRQYPNTALAGRLLGFTGDDDKGLDGLEKTFDEHLSGRSASFVVERDAAGRRLYFDVQGDEVDVRGKDLTLTIDAHVQAVAQDALAKAVERWRAKWGGALVVETATGNILAWAEYPFFNPNVYSQYKPQARRNGVLLDAMEQGSTMKTFVVAAAMQERIVNRSAQFNCENGRWEMDGKPIRDTHAYGVLPVHKILRYSSNIGSAKIAGLLGKQRYHHYLSKLGFGERVFGFGGESRGILRPPQQWRDLDLANAGFGQGFAVTLPQTARAYLCIANNGVRKGLRLVEKPEQPAEFEERVFDERVAKEVQAMLKEVVEEDGTGTQARIRGITAAGKTGTAQKRGAGGGYGDKYLASFVGFIPADKPQYVVVVSIDEPEGTHYGGVVSAPAFREIGVRTLSYAGVMPEAPALDLEVRHEREIKNRSDERGVEKRLAAAEGGVPDVVGLPLRRAVEAFRGCGGAPVLVGSGPYVVKQFPHAGAAWSGHETGAAKAPGTACTFWLAERS